MPQCRLLLCERSVDERVLLSEAESLLWQAGHAVHEDQSAKTAEVIASFIQRFRVGLPKMQIPRAGDGATRVLPVAAGPAFTH